MADERLRLIAEMRDRLTPALRRLKTVMESTGRVNAFKKLAGDMAFAERAGYRLGFALGRTLKWGAIGAGVGAGAAGAAFVKFGKQAADALDDQAAFAKQINWSADSLRTLQGVAKRYNVEQEQLRGGLQKFTTSFGRLKQGQGAFLTYLKKTNPALAEQFKHVGTGQEAFLLLSDAIAKTADPAKRAALVKAAGLPQQFLRFFADGPDDLRQTIKEVIRFQGLLGPEASKLAADYGDRMDNIGLAWEGLRDKLAVTALPIVNPMLEDLANFVADNREGIASGFKDIAVDVGQGLRSLATALPKDSKAWKEFWTELKSGGEAVKGVADSVLGLVAAIKQLGGWKAVIGAFIAYKAVGGAPGIFDALGGLLGGKGNGAEQPGNGKSPSVLPLVKGPLIQWLLYSLGEWGIKSGLRALPRPDNPSGYDPDTFDPWVDLKKLFHDWETKPGVRTQIDPGVIKRAQDDAIAFRRDPEGARGRMRIQLGRRAEIDAAAKTLVELDAAIAEMRKSGADKQFAEKFADIVARRNAIAANVERARATDIGKSIGKAAGDSFLDTMRQFFRQMSFAGPGAGSGGGRVWTAAYHPGGSGGGATGRLAAAGSFAGKGMLDLIGAAEGTDKGRGYNETLGYGRFTGGNVNLTGMTLDQIDALQTRMLRHPANKWNSSALGRYQFVRTRLRDLRKRYGISGSATFSPDLQDALARLSIAERGGSVGSLRNEWEGLRKVPDRDIKGAMQRHRKSKQEARQTIEGSASLDIRFPNGMPAGTRVGSKVAGLFRDVTLDTGRAMKLA